jgi:hypothetical protein
MAKAKRGQPVPASYRRGRRPQRPGPPKRSGRQRRLFLIGAIASGIALGLVAASLLSARDDDSAAPAPQAGAEVFGADVVESLFDGIPQDSDALGDPDAPVTLVEYADLQCPFCAQWASRTLPDLVEDYVRAVTFASSSAAWRSSAPTRKRPCVPRSQRPSRMASGTSSTSST